MLQPPAVTLVPVQVPQPHVASVMLQLRAGPLPAAPHRPQRKQARSPPADKVKELRAAVRQVVAPKLSNQLRQAAAVQMVQRLHM